MRTEAEQSSIGSPLLATELTDIELTPVHTHVGYAGIADVGVMRPDYGSGVRPHVIHDLFQGLEHVRVSQVPAFGRTVIHHAVVAFGARDHAGILDGVEEAIAIAPRLRKLLLQQVCPLVRAARP